MLNPHQPTEKAWDPVATRFLSSGVLKAEQVERLKRHILDEFEAERESQLEGVLVAKMRREEKKRT